LPEGKDPGARLSTRSGFYFYERTFYECTAYVARVLGDAVHLAVLIIGQFMPGFKMDIESAAALVVIVVMYLVGIAVDPGRGGGRG
jgi:hypothetical protein